MEVLICLFPGVVFFHSELVSVLAFFQTVDVPLNLNLFRSCNGCIIACSGGQWTMNEFESSAVRAVLSDRFSSCRSDHCRSRPDKNHIATILQKYDRHNCFHTQLSFSSSSGDNEPSLHNSRFIAIFQFHQRKNSDIAASGGTTTFTILKTRQIYSFYLRKKHCSILLDFEENNHT